MAVSSFPCLWRFTTTNAGAVEQYVFLLREFDLDFHPAAAVEAVGGKLGE